MKKLIFSIKTYYVMRIFSPSYFSIFMIYFLNFILEKHTILNFLYDNFMF